MSVPLMPVTPRGKGAVLAFLILCEGIWLLYNYGQDGIFEGWTGLGHQNPFRGLQLWILLWTGIADCALASYAILGLTILLRESVVLLFWYRCLVTLVAAPFAGILISWSSPHMGTAGAYIAWFIYITVNVGITSFLGYIIAAEKQWHPAPEKQRHPNAKGEADSENNDYNYNAVESEEHQVPKLFICLPIELTVAAWMLVTGIMSVVWVFWLCLSQNFMVGGWAFMASNLPLTASTKWLEVIVYIVAIIASLSGLIGIIKYKELCWELMLGVGPSVPVDDPREREKGNAFILISFTFNLLRVALFFPITGMVLFKNDFCGFYMKARDFSMRTQCKGDDVYVWCWGMIVLLVDLYLLWGQFQLWHYNELQCSKERTPEQKSLRQDLTNPYDPQAQPQTDYAGLSLTTNSVVEPGVTKEVIF